MRSTGTIRTATAADVPAIQRLMMRDSRYRISDDRLLMTERPGQYLIAVDDDHGGVAAAALFSIEGPRAHLLMMVVAPDCDDARALEQRMFGVIEA